MSENEKKIGKIKRRFSKKPSNAKDNLVHDEIPSASSRSATLPASSDMASLSLHQSHSEGIFSRLKRRFHFGSSKGKYDFKSLINSPSKPHWMRRKSDETQLRHEENSLGFDAEVKTEVTKSHSVKTQRKAKSDKEEVILIRKDKRVSVLCKAENGGQPEVIFSNVENSDEDSSGAWGTIEEDPYATISSVQEEISQIIKSAAPDHSSAPLDKASLPESLTVNSKDMAKSVDDHYPYARIDKTKSESQNFILNSKKPMTRRRESDYETLDEIKQQSSLLKITSCSEHTGLSNGATGAVSTSLDPDYETLDEVKQRCASVFANIPTLQIGVNGDISKSDGKTSKDNIVHINKSQLSHVACPELPVKNSTSNTDAKSLAVGNSNVSTCLQSQQITTAPITSPKSLAPLASCCDSSLSLDQTSEPQNSAIEECIYDNPNVIIRKQSHKIVPDTSHYSRRAPTSSETPIIKTPAEEELVEKLSSLLAPPLPLRNYQKDEVKGEKLKSDRGSARHSWTSQNTRTLEFMDLKDTKRISPFSSNHNIDHHKDFHGKVSLKKLEYTTVDSGQANKLCSPVIESRGSVESVVRQSYPVNKATGHHTNNESGTAAEAAQPLGHNNTTSTSTKVAEPQGDHTQANGLSNHVTVSDVAQFCEEMAVKILEDAICRSGHPVQCKEGNPQTFQSSSEREDQERVFITINKDLNEKQSTVGSELGQLKQQEQRRAADSTRSKEVEYEAAPPTVISPITSLEITDNHLHEFSNNEAANVRVAQEKIIIRNLPEKDAKENKMKEKVNEKDAKENLMKENVNGKDAKENLMKENFNGKDAKENVMQDKVLDVNLELYKSQGARPKMYLPVVSGSLRSDQSQNSTSLHPLGLQPSGQDEHRDLVKQPSEDSHTFDEAMSPFSDSNFHEAISENFPLEFFPRSGAEDAELRLPQPGAKGGSDLSVQETVYLDSEDCESDDGLEIHKCLIIHVKRDLSIARVAKPILYSNPRLLENVISGPFTTGSCLDTHYFHNGVFKWGRYYHDYIQERSAVEAKLLNFFHFLRRMLMSKSELRVKDQIAAEMQQGVSTMQMKIEKRLKHVQDLPTFHQIRMKLLKTDKLDNWEPENPVRYKPCDSVNGIKDGENNMLPKVLILKVGGKRECRAEIVRDDLHSDDYMSEHGDSLCPVGCIHSPCLSPTKPVEILQDFIALSTSSLTCTRCGREEESDSEDEMIVVETYAKTVCRLASRVSPHRINYTNNAFYCRALHGELAYTAKMRKSRASEKVLLVPGHDEDCGGSESHISWNNWCSMDSIFKKLLPHISPRLDFQYLLKTYAEFKFFILKDRNRNFDLKGCFTKKYFPSEERCCRFEEFVFLKLIRDELQYFASVLRRSKATEALFLEERHVGFSLLGLLKIVLRNIHKMKRSNTRENISELGPTEDFHFPNAASWKHFRHSAFTNWTSELLDEAGAAVEEQDFHYDNLSSFRTNRISKTLKEWMSPQDYMHDPNVLVSCRTVFAHTDTRSIELDGMRGTEEPKPLQEREDFLESMEQLQWKEWYWGPISYEQAALILKDKEDGSFLVRDSSDQKYLLSLSFKSLGEVHHTRIEHAKGLFSFWSQPESHGKARICEFIEKSIQNSKDGRFLYFLRPSARGTPPLPIRLLFPVPRNFRVATLKHLSRFVVRQTVRKDHLDLLPVPEKVKRYLKHKQYYVEIHDYDQWAFDGDYVKS